MTTTCPPLADTVQALSTAFFFAASDARPWYVRAAAWEGTSGSVTSTERNGRPTSEQPASSEQQPSEHSLSGSSEEMETAIMESEERRRRIEELMIAPGFLTSPAAR